MSIITMARWCHVDFQHMDISMLWTPSNPRLPEVLLYSLLQKFRATLFIVVFFVKFLHGPQTLLKLPFAVIALLPTELCHDFFCYVSLC